jgi:ribokinase
MKKIIVFGSNILDMFFEVPDFGFFSQSGAGAEDAMHFKTHKQAPGGKGANQAVAAAKAGAKVKFYGALGKGAHARFILDNFKAHKIDTKGIIQTDEPTGCAAIFTKPDGKHKIIVSQGANGLARADQIPDAQLNPNTILLLQAEMNATENQKLMQRGKAAGATIVLNVAPAKPMSAKTLACVDYLIVNEPEAEALAKNLNLPTDNLQSAAQTIAKKFNLMCIVTLGEKGSLAYNATMPEPLHVPALSIKVKDTVGAGDAFAGAFAAALAKDLPAELALRHAAVAGSLACRKFGAQTALPTEAEIAAALPKLKVLSPVKSAARALSRPLSKLTR